MKKTPIYVFLLLLILAVCPAFADVIATQGRATLESQDGQMILKLRGTPYERGFQHGVLLKDQIQHNITTFIDGPKGPFQSRVNAFIEHLPELLSIIPDHFKEEMAGLSDGADIAYDKILMLNLFPEMFHCSGITVSGAATQGELYHVRVLDYSIGKQLQKTAVLQVVEPDGKIPFMNVSYAGFIGTITGMNLEKIALGEIGGHGYGQWNGIPMAFLLREILENATNLDEVKSILENSPRTCEYYYVFSDGKSKESIGVYATENQLEFIAPGTAYTFLPALPPYQAHLVQSDDSQAECFRQQPADCLLLTGFPHPEKYPVLSDRILENYGKIDVQILMEIIKRPVAHPSNLHNAIFQPSELKVWIAHAGPNDEPACDQPYHAWDLKLLLNTN